MAFTEGGQTLTSSISHWQQQRSHRRAIRVLRGLRGKQAHLTAQLRPHSSSLESVLVLANGVSGSPTYNHSQGRSFPCSSILCVHNCAARLLMQINVLTCMQNRAPVLAYHTTMMYKSCEGYRCKKQPLSLLCLLT